MKKYLGDKTRWGRIFAIGRLRGKGLAYWIVDKKGRVTMKMAGELR